MQQGSATNGDQPVDCRAVAPRSQQPQQQRRRRQYGNRPLRQLGDPDHDRIRQLVPQGQRQLLNRWSMFALFFVSALATVGYVSNVLAVNELSAQVDLLKHQRDSLQTLHQSLRQQAMDLQSITRITHIATTRLNLEPPSEAPTVISE